MLLLDRNWDNLSCIQVLVSYLESAVSSFAWERERMILKISENKMEKNGYDLLALNPSRAHIMSLLGSVHS